MGMLKWTAALNSDSRAAAEVTREATDLDTVMALVTGRDMDKITAMDRVRVRAMATERRIMEVITLMGIRVIMPLKGISQLPPQRPRRHNPRNS